MIDNLSQKKIFKECPTWFVYIYFVYHRADPDLAIYWGARATPFGTVMLEVYLLADLVCKYSKLIIYNFHGFF